MRDVIRPLRKHRSILGLDWTKLDPTRLYKVTLDGGVPKIQTDPKGEYFGMFGIEILEEILNRKNIILA